MLLSGKKLFYSLSVVFISFCVYLSSYFVLNGEVHLTNDVGRDFLLLQELDLKKIVLIGARANTQNVFHGPLWTYLNYPAYLIGHGNPVIVAWFWILLGIFFLVTTFLLMRKILDTTSALLACCLLAVGLISRSNEIFGQLAPFYVMPFFLLTMFSYIKNKKFIFLVVHFLALGMLIQFNVGVGGLFALLSLILSVVVIYKNKQWKHLLVLFVLPMTLINFIVFDLRHQLKMTKALLSIGTSHAFLTYSEWVSDRIGNLITMQIRSANGILIPLIIFFLVMFFTWLEIKNSSKQKLFFLILIFYYFGYMLLSFSNKGLMLIDHVYLLVPLSVMWLAALAKGKYKYVFIALILILILVNLVYAVNYLVKAKEQFIGKSPDSWVALETVAKRVIAEQKGHAFGYFVYSPDAFAYQQRYAMLYAFSSARAKSFEYVKKDITYVIAAPHPQNNPYMNEDWWIKNAVRISNSPTEKLLFPSGYKIEKFNLTAAEQKISFDQNIELKLTFR